MAVVRARTAPPYALIAFIALWVVSTILAVLFYLQWNKSEQARDTLARSTAKVYSPADLSGVGTNINTWNNDPTYPTTLSKAGEIIKRLNLKINGIDAAAYGDTLEASNTALKNAGFTPDAQGVSLVSALQQVSSELKSKTALLADTQKTIDTLQKQLASSNEGNMTALQARDRTIADLRKQIDDSNKIAQQTRQEKEDALKKAQDDIQKARDDADAQVRKQALQVQDLQGQVTKLQADIKELQTRLAIFRGGKTTTVGEADGQIVRTNPAQGDVYINLTSHDRLSPGLTFTVYDRRAGVHYGTDEEAKGKGTVEVVEAGDQVSRCRVTHTEPGQSIQPGDVISNVVYNSNKERKLRFVVFGRVDLDGDGKATMDEHDRLISLIRQWGGVVDDDVSAQTDYLILGGEPQGVAGEDNPTPGSVADIRNKEITQYRHLVSQASTLSVPILNINRFLSMIGYYGTTVVRY